ncbi:uncharacterized protein LOC124887133 [Capsicum annuum]|uniref:uncharacterized protein LOC124887133 n=1 Tax=Capsicum annuum TaxID=4072 RepID=UPI001FB15785|nr:uncharacterized protein LOC124887133 [Capsicum annuum]
MVELWNSGSSYSIIVYRMYGSFIYYFSEFGACVRVYAYLRKVNVVNGTHLYNMYDGVFLSVIAQDTKYHIFPIIFCVVDKQNDACWTFFFEKLKTIVEYEPNLYVIFDRNIRIPNAFSRIYNCVHHGLCMRHLAKIFRVNQHCGEHLYLFYATAKAYSLNEFSYNFTELKNKCPEVAHVLENVLDFEKWSKAHFLGNRYDVMTINITESLNLVLTDEQKYPVSYEWHAFVGNSNNKFVPCAEKILRDNKSARDSLYVTNANGNLDQLIMFGNGVTSKVNLLERSCSCRKYYLVKLSYEHAMAALQVKYGDG